MLRVVTLKKFDVSFIGSENSKDYNMVVSFSIEEDVGELFGNRPRRIIIPYYFGITDTTINDQNYNCIVFIDDEDKSVIAHEYVQSLFAFFVKKFEVFKEDIIPSEPAKTPQSIEERFGSKFRPIKGPDVNISVNIGSDSVEFIAGDNKIIVSSNGISIYGNVTDYNLPSKSQGGLLKETGLLRMFPKCFVPPFALPDYIPNMDLMNRVSGMMNILKAMGEVLDV